MRSLWRREDGVAAVEFGLLLPVLMAILLGTIDYGYAFMVKLAMTNAAREGARVGITMPADTAQSAAEAAAIRYLQSAGIDSATVSANTPSDSDPEVRVSISLDPYTPLIGFVPTPDSLSASSIMRWELATPSP
jgi:Flp pilus assembly protein TadG